MTEQEILKACASWSGAELTTLIARLTELQRGAAGVSSYKLGTLCDFVLNGKTYTGVLIGGGTKAPIWAGGDAYRSYRLPWVQVAKIRHGETVKVAKIEYGKGHVVAPEVVASWSHEVPPSGRGRGR
jgi:hypothetical protein